MAAAWARLVITVLVSALLVAGCGGDNQQSSDSSGSGTPSATPPPTPQAVTGGGGAQGPRSSSALRQAAKRLKRDVRERCESVGKVVRVSASTAKPEARKTQMTKERRYLEALDEALGAVAKRPPERGTGELRRLLEQYRSRLRAQSALDLRIATAEDSYSVSVGISQNEKNRDARNAIVAEAGFDACLRAPKPR